MKGLIMASLLSIGGTAASADDTVLNAAQLDGLLTGNTAYIAIPAGGPGGPDGGTVPFKFGANGHAAAKLPTGTTLVGTWRIDADRYCVDWENGPKNSCTKIIKSAAGLAMIDAVNGDPRGDVEQLVPGNPEQL